MRSIICGFVMTLICFMPVLSPGQELTGNVNAFLGTKFLEKVDWEPAENHNEFGILVDFREQVWPVSIAIDILYSKGDGSAFDPFSGLFIDIEGETTELNVGVRKIWEQHSSVRPYVGGGLAFILAEFSGTALGLTVSDNDNAIGFWINSGIYWTLGKSFNIGLNLRYSQAEVSLFGIDGEAGGSHTGLLLGYHW